MPFDMNRLLDLLPLAVGAMKPGSPEAAAMMRGYQQSQSRMRQEAVQKQAQGRQDDLAQAQIQNLQADNQRADQAAQATQQQQALSRLLQFRQAAGQRGQQLSEGASDPLQAQNQLTTDLLGMTKAFNVGPEAMAGTLPNMTAMVSGRKKKQAQDLYAQAEKTYGQEAMANDSITLQTGDTFGDVKPSQLRQMFQPPAVTTQGAPAQPFVKDPESTSVGSFDAQFADVLAAEEAKVGHPLGRAEKAALRLKAKTEYDKANDKPTSEPRARFNVQPITHPDGTTGLVRINIDTGDVAPVDLNGADSGRAGDTQRLSAAYAMRTTASDKTANSFEANLSKLGPQLSVQLPNLLTTKEGQQYRQAEAEFINAALRRESGAAIQPSEYTRFEQIYFVRPGDTAETIAQKQEARRRVIAGFKTAAGGLSADAPPRGPKVGERRTINGTPAEWDGHGWLAVGP